MKVDLSKVQEVIIKNDKGEVEDRFFLSSASLVKSWGETYLELKKVNNSSTKKVVVKTCYCGNPVDATNPDCEAFNLCKDHAADS